MQRKRSPLIGNSLLTSPDYTCNDMELENILDCKNLPLSKWTQYNLDADSSSGWYSDNEYSDSAELRSKRKIGKNARYGQCFCLPYFFLFPQRYRTRSLLAIKKSTDGMVLPPEDLAAEVVRTFHTPGIIPEDSELMRCIRSPKMFPSDIVGWYNLTVSFGHGIDCR